MKLQTLKRTVAMLPTRVQPAPTPSTQRIRGRAGVERRTRWLCLRPLCWACLLEGRVTAGDVVDHHLPLWGGGVDDESNFGTLCQQPHHDAKSACEARMRAAGGFNLAVCGCGLHAVGIGQVQANASGPEIGPPDAF